MLVNAMSVVKSFYFYMKFSRLIEITNLLNNISAYALLLICQLGMYIEFKTFEIGTRYDPCSTE